MLKKRHLFKFVELSFRVQIRLFLIKVGQCLLFVVYFAYCAPF